MIFRIAISCLTVCASFAQAAPSRVLTTNGLGGVRIGMTKAQAEAAIGAKFGKDDGSPESKGCFVYTRADGMDSNLGYMIEKGHLTRIEVFTPKRSDMPVTTDKGIGIGSTLAQVKRAYGKALVNEPDRENESAQIKIVGQYGAIIFTMEKQRVRFFRAGAYPSVEYNEGCE